MPIKLKKTNIQYDIDAPDAGYIILGFDESGNLVTKNEQGDYEPIINDISTGNFERLQVDFLTVGNRVSGAIEGDYTIAQGLNITAEGNTSFAQGNNAVSSGVYSYARGEFVEASGILSHASGRGAGSVSKLVSSGLNSFVHMVSTGGGAGALADYSAILGGRNNNIGTSATDSVIIGGTTNTINASVLNSVILGGSSQTAINNNTVYMPRMVLTNTSVLTQGGAIYYNGTNFYGHNGLTAKRLDLTLSNAAANRVVLSNISGNLDASSTLSYSGTALLVGSGNGTVNGVTLNGGAITATGNITTTNGTVNITDSSASATPLLTLTNTNGSSGSDATIGFTTGGLTYAMGIDNGDNYFKLYYGTELGATDSLTVFEHYYNATVSSRYTRFHNALKIDQDAENNYDIPGLEILNTGTGERSAHVRYGSSSRTYVAGINSYSYNASWQLYYGSNFPTSDAASTDAHMLSFDGFYGRLALGRSSTFNLPAKFTVQTTTEESKTYAMAAYNLRNNAAASGMLFQTGEDTPTATDNIIMRFENGTGGGAGYMGAIYFDNGGVHYYSVISDVRRKTNITGTTINGLDILTDLELKDFNYRKSYNVPVTGVTDEYGNTGITSYNKVYTDEYFPETNLGYIAQDAIDIYPKLVKYLEADDHWSIDYTTLVPVLHKAILEQQGQITLLEQRIYDLENPV